MAATKSKPKAKKPAKAKAKKPAKKKTGGYFLTGKAGTRYATGKCKSGHCRLRTKGMKVGDTRKRMSEDGKQKFVITRVP